VAMLRPQDSIERFNKVFVFKEKPNTLINKKIKIDLGDKKVDCLGYNFYHKNPNLIPEIAATPPSYLPYVAFTERLADKKLLDKMQKNSYIRVGTNDFSGFKSERKDIYIADYNFIEQSNALDFLRDYHENHKFIFLYPLIFSDQQLCEDFAYYSKSLKNRELIADFDYDSSFIVNNIDKPIKILYKGGHPIKDLKTIIYLKKIGGRQQLKLSKDYKVQDELSNKIFKWYYSDSQLSYYNFYKEDSKAISLMNKSDSEIRLLLKQNPLTFESKSIDF
jgi:hypothetical protein